MVGAEAGEGAPRGETARRCSAGATAGGGEQSKQPRPVLSAAVARYTGLFGQLPCLSLCLGDAG